MNRVEQERDRELPILAAAEAAKPRVEAPLISDHQLVRLIATGAYGEVWLGLNAVGTPRAIKIVRRDQHISIESFDREFKGLQKFEPVSRSHEGLVDILTLGLLPDDTGFYYVMELADSVSGRPLIVQTSSSAEAAGRIGPTPNQREEELRAYAPRTLRAELKSRGCFSADEVIALGLKLTDALAHLHAQGLVHRDVKPSNILFIDGQPKLADAGLVAGVDDALSLVGTAGYIAPEGSGTPRADIYALGKVLYEVAFGKDRQEFPELPVDVASRRDHARLLELNEIIAKACAYDPKRRYASAEAMCTELRLLESGRSVKTRHIQQKIWSVCKKVGLAVALGALVVTITSRFMRKGTDEYDQSSDPEVNKFVEQGFVAWREGTPERIRYAEEQFQKALQKDTNFVPALYGLAIVYLNDLTKVREITEKLKKIAPDSAETAIEVAYIEWHEGRFRQALADMKKATRLRPACKEGKVWAHGGYGYFLQNLGDAQGALQQYRQAERIIDGIDPTILDHLGHTYYMRSNLVEALNYYQASINFMPTHLNGRYWKARTLEEMRRFDEAIKEYGEANKLAGEDTAETKLFYDGLREALHKDGPAGYWHKWLEEEKKKPSPELYRIAMFHARLKEWDRAYYELERAFKQTSFAGELMVDLCWDRNDERFKAFARKIGLMKN